MRKILRPKNDAEANVIVYREMERPFKETLREYADKTAKGMFDNVKEILTSAGYTGGNKATIMVKPANPSTIRHLEALAEKLPTKQRKAMLSKLYGSIGNGSLTVRKAINNAIHWGIYEHSEALFDKSLKSMRSVAKEGMLRGEYMVQKGAGVGWKLNSPGINKVDAFLKDKWTQNKATEYLRPLSEIVKDEVEQSLFLGESPDVMAKRMRKVQDIDIVRSERNARTITNAVANEAHADSYKRHGVKRYEFVATFDERTCPVCGSLDGKSFDLTDKQPGANFPPLHPNCRCTTVASLSQALKEQLYANFEVHNKDGTVDHIDARMTYEDWKKGHVTDKPIVKPKKPRTVKDKVTPLEERQQRFTPDAETKRVEKMQTEIKEREEFQTKTFRDALNDAYKANEIPQELYESTSKYLEEHPDASQSTLMLKLGYGHMKPFTNRVRPKLEEWDKAHPQTIGNDIRRSAVNRNLKYRAVEVREQPLAEEEIITKIGGRDKTRGSCVSQAFTYLGNKIGLNVTDFRGGKSCDYFAGSGWMKLLDCGDGAKSMGMQDTIELLGTMEKGEEYLLVAGKHCSIVRMGENGPEYLELQSEVCGWKKMDGGVWGSLENTLHERFGVRATSTKLGGMVNIKNIQGKEDVLETLGYINTDPTKAKRGAGGGIK